MTKDEWIEIEHKSIGVCVEKIMGEFSIEDTILNRLKLANHIRQFLIVNTRNLVEFMKE